MGEPLQRKPCGCTYRGEQWVKMCEPHQKESDEVSERWAADRQRQRELEDLLS